MSKTELSLLIDEPGWEQVLDNIENLSRRIFQTAVDYVAKHENLELLQLDKPLSLNLSLSSDEDIRKLNADFRHLDKPTNVLSFANIDDETFAASLSSADTVELGDVIIALETMQREAADKNISLHDHYCHLFTHGILHLLGFDHCEDDEAEYMENYEIQILGLLNVKNPYQE